MFIRIPYKGSDGCVRNFRLTRRVQKDWRNIARCLKISSDIIKLLESLYRESPDDFDICVHMFRDWLAKESAECHRTWDELIRVLKEINLSEVADAMHRALKG